MQAVCYYWPKILISKISLLHENEQALCCMMGFVKVTKNDLCVSIIELTHEAENEIEVP